MMIMSPHQKPLQIWVGSLLLLRLRPPRFCAIEDSIHYLFFECRKSINDTNGLFVVNLLKTGKLFGGSWG